MRSAADLMADLFSEHQPEIDNAEALVRRLIDQRAGLAADPTGQDGRCRLRQPRLITTAPLQRRLALEKKALDYRDLIAQVLPQLTAAMIKLSICEDEIAAIHDREREARSDWVLFKEQGMFMSAALAMTNLYENYGVTRWHWSNVTGEQLAAIGAILKRDKVSGDVA